MRYCLSKNKCRIEYGPSEERTKEVRVLTHNEFDALPDNEQMRLIDRELRGELQLQLVYAL